MTQRYKSDKGTRRQEDGEAGAWLKGVLALLLACVSLVACTPPAPTAAPTATQAPYPVTCSGLDVAWAASDWPAVLDILAQLEAGGLTCGPEPLDAKRYAAHYNYAVALESAGETDAAIAQYWVALAVNGRGQETLDALVRLDALPDPTPFTCHPGELAPYAPPTTTLQAFVTAQEDRLVANGENLFVRGVNYYPRNAPWERFLTQGDLGEMARELDLIAAAGFNTVRIFLWYEPLFTCAPEEAVPNPEAFAKLDAFITLAHERGLYLIVTLNDLPDLCFCPLYTTWTRYDAQTAFIVRRYRDEPAILAWDLRNEGDLDHGAGDGEGRFAQETVLAWLAHAAEVVRANDDRHLITAGWWGDPLETAGTVDMLSFHHWSGTAELKSRTRALEVLSDKPVLLEEVGFPSLGENGEAWQAQMLGSVISAAEESNIAGWLVWTAFDFTPAEGQPTGPEHHFGLWRTDLTAKPALELLRRPTEGEEK